MRIQLLRYSGCVRTMQAARRHDLKDTRTRLAYYIVDLISFEDVVFVNECPTLQHWNASLELDLLKLHYKIHVAIHE